MSTVAPADSVLGQAKGFVTLGQYEDARLSVSEYFNRVAQRHQQAIRMREQPARGNRRVLDIAWEPSYNELFDYFVTEVCFYLKDHRAVRDALRVFRQTFASLRSDQVRAASNSIADAAYNAMSQIASNLGEEKFAEMSLDSSRSVAEIVESAFDIATLDTEEDADDSFADMHFWWEVLLNILESLRFNNEVVEGGYVHAARVAIDFCVEFNRPRELATLYERMARHIASARRYADAHAETAMTENTISSQVSLRVEVLRAADKLGAWQTGLDALEGVYDVYHESGGGIDEHCDYLDFLHLAARVFRNAGHWLYHSIVLLTLFHEVKNNAMIGSDTILGEEFDRCALATQVLLACMSVPDETMGFSSLALGEVQTTLASAGTDSILSALNIDQNSLSRGSLLRAVRTENVAAVADPLVAELFGLVDNSSTVSPFVLRDKAVEVATSEVVAKFEAYRQSLLRNAGCRVIEAASKIFTKVPVTTLEKLTAGLVETEDVVFTVIDAALRTFPARVDTVTGMVDFTAPVIPSHSRLHPEAVDALSRVRNAAEKVANVQPPALVLSDKALAETEKVAIYAAEVTAARAAELEAYRVQLIEEAKRREEEAKRLEEEARARRQRELEEEAERKRKFLETLAKRRKDLETRIETFRKFCKPAADKLRSRIDDLVERDDYEDECLNIYVKYQEREENDRGARIVHQQRQLDYFSRVLCGLEAERRTDAFYERIDSINEGLMSSYNEAVAKSEAAAAQRAQSRDAFNPVMQSITVFLQRDKVVEQFQDLEVQAEEAVKAAEEAKKAALAKEEAAERARRERIEAQRREKEEAARRRKQKRDEKAGIKPKTNPRTITLPKFAITWTAYKASRPQPEAPSPPSFVRQERPAAGPMTRAAGGVKPTAALKVSVDPQPQVIERKEEPVQEPKKVEAAPVREPAISVPSSGPSWKSGAPIGRTIGGISRNSEQSTPSSSPGPSKPSGGFGGWRNRTGAGPILGK